MRPMKRKKRSSKRTTVAATRTPYELLLPGSGRARWCFFLCATRCFPSTAMVVTMATSIKDGLAICTTKSHCSVHFYIISVFVKCVVSFEL